MYYKSENGYEGTFKKGCFLVLKHYDLTIFKDGKMVYHCTYSEPLTEEGFRKEVDEFPEFLKRLMKVGD